MVMDNNDQWMAVMRLSAQAAGNLLAGEEVRAAECGTQRGAQSIHNG